MYLVDLIRVICVASLDVVDGDVLIHTCMRQRLWQCMLLLYKLCNDNFSCVSEYTHKYGVAWWDPIPNVGEIGGGWSSLEMDGWVTTHILLSWHDHYITTQIRLELLQILCCGKPLLTYFYPDMTTISLHRLVLHGIPK